LGANGIGRTGAVRHDVDGQREAIPVRVDFGPHASFPAHSHPGVEIAYVLEGRTSTGVRQCDRRSVRADDAGRSRRSTMSGTLRRDRYRLASAP
jgi:anti-sigma factor ChrR (cupin superfamily)